MLILIAYNTQAFTRHNNDYWNSRYMNYLKKESRKNIGLILSVVLLFSCNQEQQVQKLSNDAVILAFGDSITFGTGARPNESYPFLLEKLTNRKVINAGVPGEVTSQGLKRLPGLIDKYHPEMMILCHGGNDIIRKKNLDTTENNLKKMISLAQSNDIRVILLGVPEPGIFLSSADFYRDVAQEMNILYVDDIIADVLSNADNKSDPIHPNKAGYKLIAEQLFSILRVNKYL